MDLFNKYRPKQFADVAQPHVTRILQAQVTSDAIVSTYLFTGPAGTGKTTLARVMAMAIQDLDRPVGTSEPTDSESVRQILDKTHRDVVEINCADQNGVDDVRQGVIERMRVSPSDGKYRVFILDECLDYNAAVELADGTRMKIGQIVSRRSEVDVLSYNFETGELEPRRVTGWHKNSPNPVYRWRFQSTDGLRPFSLRATEDHRVFVGGEERRLKNLVEGDAVSVFRRVNSTPRKHLHQQDRGGGPLYLKQEAAFVGRDLVQRHGAHTYDITVEGNHNYMANGVLVHNCHMLTVQAQNALLKVLEEPPSFVKFFLCSTDPHKILGTIRSRCQPHNLRLVPDAAMREILCKVIGGEGLDAQPDALDLIVQEAAGGVRAALRLVEKVAPIGITEANVRETIGRGPKALAANMLIAAVRGDRATVLQAIEATQSGGHSLQGLMEDAARLSLQVVKCKATNTEPSDENGRKVFEAYSAGKAILAADRVLEAMTQLRQNLPQDVVAQMALMKLITQITKA
jgi:DNA polymerase III subunit gamma/tau